MGRVAEATRPIAYHCVEVYASLRYLEASSTESASMDCGGSGW